MRDINRIDEVCDKLKEIWKRVPDWRFMQLMCNFQRGIDTDGFYVEDDAFVNALNMYLDAVLNPQGEEQND